MTSPLVVSCLFGPQEFDIYPAPNPEQHDCIFFTNRKDIATLAEQRGWTPCLMPYPQSRDPLECALQSKAVKFLNFMDAPYFSDISEKADKGILYFDHKFNVTGEHVNKIVARSQGAAILLRSTPTLKNSVWDEVEAAETQERYARNMPETKLYINRLLKDGFSAETLVCNTGLIYYSDIRVATSLAWSVSNACMLLRQPECQIFWALHAQRYSEDICVIDWEDPATSDIIYKDPLSSDNKPAPRIRRLSRVGRKIKKFWG